MMTLKIGEEAKRRTLRATEAAKLCSKFSLTDTRLHSQSVKGLCFHNNEKLGIGHHCKKSLQSLLVYDDDDLIVQGEDPDSEDLEDEKITEGTVLHAWAAQRSIMGWTTTCSMTLKGELEGQ